MNLVAIALLCQVTGVSDGAPFTYVQDRQKTCQQYYVNCWNKKREDQLAEANKGSKLNSAQIYDPEAFLAKCVLERP